MKSIFLWLRGHLTWLVSCSVSSLLWAEERKRPPNDNQTGSKGASGSLFQWRWRHRRLVDHQEAEAIVQMGKVYFGWVQPQCSWGGWDRHEKYLRRNIGSAGQADWMWMVLPDCLYSISCAEPTQFSEKRRHKSKKPKKTLEEAESDNEIFPSKVAPVLDQTPRHSQTVIFHSSNASLLKKI